MAETVKSRLLYSWEQTLGSSITAAVQAPASWWCHAFRNVSQKVSAEDSESSALPAVMTVMEETLLNKKQSSWKKKFMDEVCKS